MSFLSMVDELNIIEICLVLIDLPSGQISISPSTISRASKSKQIESKVGGETWGVFLMCRQAWLVREACRPIVGPGQARCRQLHPSPHRNRNLLCKMVLNKNGSLEFL